MFKRFKTDDCDILTVKGKLMGGPETNDFRILVSEIQDEGEEMLIVDLGELQWINSAGVGALISSYVTYHNKNKKIKFVNLSPKVQEVLKITRLDTVLEIHATVDEAKY